MKLVKYYILMIIEIITIYVLYMFQGYQFDNPCYIFLLHSIILFISIKTLILISIFLLNIFTRSFYNRYFYMLLKIYSILIVYSIILNIKELI